MKFYPVGTLCSQAGDLWTSLVFRYWKEVNGEAESEGENIWNQVCDFDLFS